MKTKRNRETGRGRRVAAFALLFSLAAAAAVSAQSATVPGAFVADQPVVDGRVTVARVVSTGPGWIVIHTQTPDGKVGPVIGWAAVRGGENLGVVVAVDAAKVTPVLSAMLHVDAGTIGAYEFPGADAPARAGDAMINPPFKTAAAPTAPSAVVLDQAVVDGRVTVARVVSAGPGWIVIHTQTPDGKVGPVVGWAAVRGGENLGVVVAVDAAKLTPVLSAMLHVDAGTIGTYEFPGADAPARAGDAMINPPFKVGSN